MPDATDQFDYAFIPDMVEIDRSILPFDLGHGFVCDVATLAERESVRPWLRKELGRFIPMTDGGHGATEMYEYGWTGTPPQLSALPEDQHRYFVFRKTDSGLLPRFDVLKQVGRLCDPELVPTRAIHYEYEDQVRLAIEEVPANARFHTRMLQPLLDPEQLKAIPRVEAGQLKRLRDLVGWYAALDGNPSRITRALSLFEQCDEIRQYAGMWPLAHFAVIEALLTHKPQPGDPADSLTRQLQTSIPLLLRRSHDVELDAPFGINAKLPKVVKLLYGFRSEIAHGKLLVGETLPNQLTALGDYRNACDVLRTMTKKLLAQALAEPDLTIDLSGPDR